MTDQTSIESTKETTEPRILLSVFACSPEWGSEVGMGWNWVVALSRYARLDVITETSFRSGVESMYATCFQNCFPPTFHYIEMSPKGIKAFWNQGSWSFYYYYRKWQKDAYRLACSLTKDIRFDAIHQLNLVGFREPGFLWKIPDVPFIWGPICGMGLVPYRFINQLNWKNRTKYCVKNILNWVQQYSLPRVKSAAQKAVFVFAVTPTEQDILKKHYKKDSVLLSELAANPPQRSLPRKKEKNTSLNLVWNGIMEGRKGLNLLLYALAKVKKEEKPFSLNIIGDGPCFREWKHLSESLKIDDCCVWHGRIDHKDALNIMNQADVFVFSSWKEATSTVVNEALSLGLPVVCHDCCGMSYAINEQCGIKIPFVNPAVSIQGFYTAITTLLNKPELIAALSAGALSRAQEISWDNHAKIMCTYYRKSQKLYDKTA